GEKINLPGVTRSRFEFSERHIKLLKVMLAESVDDRKTQDQRYDELVKTIVGMKKEGFESPPEIIELVPEKELPKVVWEAINEVSVKNTREYYTNMAYAHEALESGKTEDEVIHHVVYGQDVEV
ncbi:hypothetical protein IIB97_00985, partial [Patescibacteria group bacterium]|nr:hypothetical protein [Patescibacteria group bacterium]